jgi:hypothetical protein
MRLWLPSKAAEATSASVVIESSTTKYEEENQYDHTNFKANEAKERVAIMMKSRYIISIPIDENMKRESRFKATIADRTVILLVCVKAVPT